MVGGLSYLVLLKSIVPRVNKCRIVPDLSMGFVSIGDHLPGICAVFFAYVVTCPKQLKAYTKK